MNKFANFSASEQNPRWSTYIRREHPIYQRDLEIRTEFWRDYNRLLHSKAYRRLKHKTQVFFATNNDHVCTRIEHVNHVCSISYSIASYLGLNTELVLAIALGHDIGHAPFGHDGERVLNKIATEKYSGNFWHEQNGLFFADNIERLQNEQGNEECLNLTYAVRDGLISHCGEVDEAALFPRTEYIDLACITMPRQYNPYTWEACVVKIADKIAYLGRDLEDATRLKILQDEQQDELNEILSDYWQNRQMSSSNTALIHSFATDLCKHSSPETGIAFSEKCFQTLTAIKRFNYQHIYSHPRLNFYKKYAELIINSIFEIFDNLYNNADLNKNIEKMRIIFPKLVSSFEKWLQSYSNVYDIKRCKEEYQRCIVGFISSMSDSYAIDVFSELTMF